MVKGESTMNKILIIEDDSVISSEIANHLASWGFETKIAADFTKVHEIFNGFNPHLILLDINLPYKNGYFICSEIRKTSKVPIIFISSASENMNIIMAINTGGDDFIVKPFDLDVLTAKINALLRRSYDFTKEQEILSVNDVCLNLESAMITFNNKEIILTKNEFLILKNLMQNHKKIVSRDELMQKLWNNEAFVDDNTLTVNITRLRKKLAEIGLCDFIETRKNLGYLINV